MKKFTILMAICLSLGMSSAFAYNPAPDKETMKTFIGEKKAKDIAFQDARIKKSQVEYIRCKLDIERGRWEYEVEFFTKNHEYEYDIDAVTGQIFSQSKELNE